MLVAPSVVLAGHPTCIISLNSFGIQLDLPYMPMRAIIRGGGYSIRRTWSSGSLKAANTITRISGGFFLRKRYSASNNYPDSLNAIPGDVDSIEAVWTAIEDNYGTSCNVVDTFLIYKIAQTRYNRNVAFIAAVLFAIMPYSWLTRRVVFRIYLVAYSFCYLSSLRYRSEQIFQEATTELFA